MERRKWRFWFWATGKQSNSAGARQYKQNETCARRKHRSAWASAQSDQSSLCIQWVATDPRFRRADSELWSDRVDAQVDLSLHLAGHFVGFVVRWLNLDQGIKGIDSPGRERVSCIPFKWLAPLYGGSCSCHFMRTKPQVQYMVDLAEKENNIDFYPQCFLNPERLRGRVVSAPDFGSRGLGFESRWKRDSFWI